jgi:hypothetical protein
VLLSPTISISLSSNEINRILHPLNNNKDMPSCITKRDTVDHTLASCIFSIIVTMSSFRHHSSVTIGLQQQVKISFPKSSHLLFQRWLAVSVTGTVDIATRAIKIPVFSALAKKMRL